jgi:hypothetical protein
MRRFAHSLQDGRSFDVLSPMTPQPLAQSGTRSGLENNPLYFSPHGARDNHSEDSSLRFLAPAYFGVLACRWSLSYSYMRPYATRIYGLSYSPMRP